MEQAAKSLLRAFDRVWNKDLEKRVEWKGSYPEWRWKESRTVDAWFTWRRREEGAEGLWRIHDGLYDLERWARAHPGGSSWITATKGTDVTEAFECHHLTDQAESLLPKFYVRDATTPRNSPFTFREDGFFRTLKRQVRQHLETNPVRQRSRSGLITDSLLGGTLCLAALGAGLNSLALCLLSGVCLCLTTICAHNYFHQRDNLRMYYFNLSLLSYRDWRVSHALSHHLYPNSRYDLEVTMLTPFLQWLPRDDKTLFSRYASWLYSPIAYTFIFHKQGIESETVGVVRWLTRPDGWREAIPLVLPAVMMLSGAGLLRALALWQLLTLAASFTFGLIGVNAAHHHPDIFHDGDYPREDKDWGLYQLDAVRDRQELRGCLPLVMTMFGDHALHHLFPTLDHSRLDALYPVLVDVCRRFGVCFVFTSQLELMRGQFLQLARVRPKSNRMPLTDATLKHD